MKPILDGQELEMANT